MRKPEARARDAARASRRFIFAFRDPQNQKLASTCAIVSGQLSTTNMAPRLARVSAHLQHKPPRRNRPSKPTSASTSRTLDAFSIATQEVTDRPRIQQHRLDASSGKSRPRKRRHNQTTGEDDGFETGDSPPRKKVANGFDGSSADEGSDSEGNHWSLGQVDDGGDSDLNSEEAFGESDEERFDGWVFRGSQDHKRSAKSVRRKRARA